MRNPSQARELIRYLVTPEAFGERLRRSRDRLGISLQAIADETKIGRRLFSDLERGDCSRWPAGIYARAYMRSYARMIALELGVSSRLCARLEPGHPGLRRPAVGRAREEQRDVHVHALGREGLDRRHALGRARDLDEDVGPRQRLPEAAPLDVRAGVGTRHARRSLSDRTHSDR